jgi:hypothetical protein
MPPLRVVPHPRVRTRAPAARSRPARLHLASASWPPSSRSSHSPILGGGARGVSLSRILCFCGIFWIEPFLSSICFSPSTPQKMSL